MTEDQLRDKLRAWAPGSEAAKIGRELLAAREAIEATRSLLGNIQPWGSPEEESEALARAGAALARYDKSRSA